MKNFIIVFLVFRTTLVVAGAGAADPGGEHDSSVREEQGRLVDKHGPLQPGAHPPRSHRGQDRVQEEPRSSHAPLPQGRAGATAQLPQGKASLTYFMYYLSDLITRGGRKLTLTLINLVVL